MTPIEVELVAVEAPDPESEVKEKETTKVRSGDTSLPDMPDSNTNPSIQNHY